MEYQMNLLDKTTNQLYKFRTKNWVEITDNINGVYSSDKKIRFILKSSANIVMHTSML